MLVEMLFVTSSFLFLVVGPGAPSSTLVASRNVPGPASSILVASRNARSYQ